MGVTSYLTSIRSSGTRIGLLALLLILMSVSAGAEPPSGNIGVGGGYHLPHAQLDVVGEAPVPTQLHGGPYVSVYGGYTIAAPIALELHVGFLPAYAGQQNKVVFLLPFHFDVVAYLFEGSVRPYVSLGVGAYTLVGGDLGKDVDFMITASAGARFELTKSLAIRADVRGTGSDGRDWPMAPSLIASLGIEFLVGGDRKADEAAPPVTPPVVLPHMERCAPNAKGELPEGCDERDGDGIPDAEDACPKTPGIAAFKGCPDTDGDGIPDTEDRCPITSGQAALSGCPDRDGDGVEDSRDGCPDTPGTAARHGCPERLHTDVERLNGVLLGVSFQSGTKLSPGSLTILSRVASTLSRHTDTKVEILVYTQEGRSNEQQTELAQERAQVIFNALVQLGAIPVRLKVMGLGAVVPDGESQTMDRIELRVSR